MKTDTRIWTHKAPADYNWYWKKKINSLKENMQEWYEHGKYTLSKGVEYLITRSYNALIDRQERMQIADLVWSRMSQPKHRFFLWLGLQRRLLTKERLLKLQVYVKNINCCLCVDQVNETHQHLFMDCQ